MIATSNKLNQYVTPIYHLVPVTFGAKNVAIFDVEQEEWQYQKGQNSTNVTMEDCLPWKRLSNNATDCSIKCLPVVFQYLWEEKVDRPRCHNNSDHLCMVQTIQYQVCKIFNNQI